MPKKPVGKKKPKRPGFIVRLPECYGPAVRDLAVRNRRSIVSEITLAIDAHLQASGLTPPPGGSAR